MDKKDLSIEEIRDIAFSTTGQSHNCEWLAHRYGKLTSSKFGRARGVIKNPQSTNIQGLRDNIYAAKNLDNVPPIKLGLDHESMTIDAYQNMSNNVMKQTALWMFRKNIRGGSPD